MSIYATRELLGMRVPGGFAEQVAVNESNVTVIADHLTFDEAALAEPLACAVHAVRLAEEGNQLIVIRKSLY